MARSSSLRPVTVAVAERHPIMRDALCGLLDGEPSIDLVGHAHCFDGLLRLLHRHRPHVCLLDPGVLDPRGLRSLQPICSAHADTAFLISAFPEGSGYEQTVRALGGAGLLSKAAAPETWLEAIADAAKRNSGDPERTGRYGSWA